MASSGLSSTASTPISSTRAFWNHSWKNTTLTCTPTSVTLR
jgi:hypothetical protein